MGSRRQQIMFFFIACSVFNGKITSTAANPLINDNFNYQLQRSPRVIGSNDGALGDSRRFDTQVAEFDHWVRQNDDRVAEKLREQFNTAMLTARNGGVGGRYFQRCTTKCELHPGFTSKSQQELDTIAVDMTNQIITDLQNGKLTRTQVNQPNWYEHRVAEKLSELDRQFQQQLQPSVDHYQSNREFSQNYHKGNTFGQTVYPSTGRDWQISTVDQQNCTQDSAYPFQVQNQQNQRHNKEDSEYIVQHGSTVPVYGGSYFTQNNFQENRQTSGADVVRPIITPQTYQHTSIVERNETRKTPPVVITLPTQRSYTSVKEEREERRETATARPIYIGGSRTQHRTSSDHYESEVVPNYRPRVVIDNSKVIKELEVLNSQIKTTKHVPIPQPQVSTTTVTKEEKTVTRNNERPLVYIPNRSVTVTNEEKHVENKVEQRPVYQPYETISKHVTNEEERFENQVQQRPIYRPYETISTKHVIDETAKETSRTLPLPVFSHHSFSRVEDVNESSKQHQVHHGITPGRQVSTVKKTTYVQISPQIENQYIINYTEEEYLERLQRAQQELQRLGYGVLTEREYNATIASGGFVHNGFKYLYNVDTGRYEKTERAEVTEHEYNSLLRLLQEQLRQYGFSQMTEQEFNETISSGTFTRNGDQYIYDSETGRYNKAEISEHEYIRRFNRIQEELQRLGLQTISESQFNQTIITNQLVIDGIQYVYNTETGRLERGQRVNIEEHEYRTTLRRLQELLTRLGFGQMTEREYNETITTGEFVRGGNRYKLNTYTGNYEKIEITEEEYRTILERLQSTLNRLGYRQLTQHESNETITTGNFIRGGYQWNYNSQTGEANRVRLAGAFEEISDAEYRQIYRRLQETLVQLGYDRMSSSECNATITSGVFVRGGNKWIYQADRGEFEHVELSAEEMQFRLTRLVEILTELKITRDENERRDIVNRGNFYHAGHRYEYSLQNSRFERIELSEHEYQERVRRLLEQLQKIGYGTMTAAQCRSTINSGVFYYGGYEWVYNHRSGFYEMGERSDKEQGTFDVASTADYDNTKYDSTKKETDAAGNNSTDSHRRKPQIISKNRGDQPPQTFEEDYEDSEEVEPEPGITPQVPVHRPRPTSPPIPPSIAIPSYPSSIDRQSFERKRTENLVSVAVPVPTQQTEYKKSYHRKETVYTQTSGGVPVQFEPQIGSYTIDNNIKQQSSVGRQAYS